MADARIRVAFRTLGCKVNQVESEAAAAALVGVGAEVVSEEAADLVVVNTCTVTGEADAKARKAVRHALNLPARPLVVVTGCLASLDADGLRALDRRVIVEADKVVLAARVAGLLGMEEPAGRSAAGGVFRTRAMLKVEDGCDAFCTYCIVPHARGVPRATPLAELVREAERLVADGVAEIVLTGVNIGRYQDGGADFAALVERVAATGIGRLRISSIEPLDLDERLLGVLADTGALQPHLHVPLQSGSDRVLAAMNRTYDTAAYAERIGAARAVIPGLAVTTDVLAGFPTETAEEAAETRAFCERIGFAKLHVFRYSVRPGTPAADMPQVHPEERASRAQALRATGDRLRDEYVSSRVGGHADVLVERVREEADVRIAEGTSGDYLKVRAHGHGEVGEVVRVRLLQADGGVVLGEAERGVAQ